MAMRWCGQRLAVCLWMLLTCLGCGPKGLNIPSGKPAPTIQPPRISSVKPATDDSATDEPIASSDSSPQTPEATSESAAPDAASHSRTGELLRETFADAAGQVRWNRDGVKSSEGPPSTRTIYFFNGMPEGGPLVMRVVEDNMTTGPDEQPGVLAFSWQELPPKLPYSGFTYLGGHTAATRLQLPPLKLAKSAGNLGPFRLTFRHKAVNAGRLEPFTLTFSCRLEPMLSEPYAKRLDLGDFSVSEQWGSFDKSFAEGKNLEAFLSAIASENPASFKVTWSQSGPLTNYRSGDTLLVDDIVITGPAVN